jgi:tRNA threonylcarbamoyl adenosine modification protein (Sua5/YciO/YrdC/YwlC family)
MTTPINCDVSLYLYSSSSNAMSTYFELHPDNPQTRRIKEIGEALAGGAVMLYPTDTVYAIGCDINHKTAVQRVRQIKQLANDKPLTFLCQSVSNIAEYAQVSDSAYRIIRRLIPGPYTFLLPATKLVPRLVMSPKRKTTGIRVPDRTICQLLLQELGNPIASTSAHLIGEDGLSLDAEDGETIDKVKLFDRLESLVDVIIDDGRDDGIRASTIIDLTAGEPTIVREGAGIEEALNWI